MNKQENVNEVLDLLLLAVGSMVVQASRRMHPAET